MKSINSEDIFFHDMRLIRLNKSYSEGLLHLEVDYPLIWAQDEYSIATILFNNITIVELSEMNFSGVPSILSVENETSLMNKDRNSLKLFTNSGTLKLYYSSIWIKWSSPDQVIKAFFDGSKDLPYQFVYNEQVVISDRTGTSQKGSIESLKLSDFDYSFVIKLVDGSIIEAANDEIRKLS
ncbi:hypothetical protein [Leptospira licerasiae]|uniref:hypothetical protein n=1 Tax=Leptospira licerasiae TaxID=447106 RepID=UPI0010842CAC|nr:hypothetical protein [Leptospira licerasiae]TGM88713.1 hypothetical protein EHR05_12485 [Leptospira licerasiae]